MNQASSNGGTRQRHQCSARTAVEAPIIISSRRLPQRGSSRAAGLLLVVALMSSGCNDTTGAGVHPSASVATTAASSQRTAAATADAGAAAVARRACAQAVTRPRTLADVAKNYAHSSAAASQAARLDARWHALAEATSALANSWQVLQRYPTRPGHPLALNVTAMTPYQVQEYDRRHAVAVQVYPILLVECRKATG